jgi:hypothetical protein
MQPPEAGSYLASCVEIDDLCLDEEFKRVAADLAYWTHQYALAQRRYLMAELEQDKVKARLHLMCKANAAFSDKGKGKTVPDLAAEVQVHPEFLAAAVELIDSDSEKLRLRGIVDAVIAKKEMLISLGAKLRVEMQGDLRLAQDMAERRRQGI